MDYTYSIWCKQQQRGHRFSWKVSYLKLCYHKVGWLGQLLAHLATRISSRKTLGLGWSIGCMIISTEECGGSISGHWKVRIVKSCRCHIFKNCHLVPSWDDEYNLPHSTYDYLHSTNLLVDCWVRADQCRITSRDSLQSCRRADHSRSARLFCCYFARHSSLHFFCWAASSRSSFL